MINTDSFETSVVITKINENGDPLVISMIDNNNNVVSKQKIRAKRNRPKVTQEGQD